MNCLWLWSVNWTSFRLFTSHLHGCSTYIYIFFINLITSFYYFGYDPTPGKETIISSARWMWLEWAPCAFFELEGAVLEYYNNSRGIDHALVGYCQIPPGFEPNFIGAPVRWPYSALWPWRKSSSLSLSCSPALLWHQRDHLSLSYFYFALKDRQRRRRFFSTRINCRSSNAVFDLCLRSCVDI